MTFRISNIKNVLSKLNEEYFYYTSKMSLFIVCHVKRFTKICITIEYHQLKNVLFKLY